MEQSTFDQYAGQGYNRIPVSKTVLADLDTPLSVYLKLADASDAYLFESVEGGENWGRYSIIGLPCRRRYAFFGHTLKVYDFGQLVREETVTDPLAKVAELQHAFKVPQIPQLPNFTGGLVGYFGYECVRFIEPHLVSEKTDELQTPDIVLLLSEEVAVFDNLAGKLFLIVQADPADKDSWQKAQRRLRQLSHRLRCGSPGYTQPSSSQGLEVSDFSFGFEKEAFLRAVERSKEYILAGDIFQVVLSQRMTARLSSRPVDIYRALRALNPSPYMYFIDLGETQIIGSSPEVLVRLEQGTAMVRPIAGTRPRGADPGADQALEEALLKDPKECAEHLMLLDLGRNDLGRVADTGAVQVVDHMVVERYSHVMHLVSEIRAALKENITPMDVVRATFPAGTLSGAPKIRAMEIINELEPVKRNIYAGAVGYLGWHDNLDLAIAIRTAVIKSGKLHVQAGAGIVADSDPETEWEETMNKGRALILAVKNATAGI